MFYSRRFSHQNIYQHFSLFLNKWQHGAVELIPSRFYQSRELKKNVKNSFHRRRLMIELSFYIQECFFVGQGRALLSR